MSGRIEKQKSPSKKTQQRIALAQLIDVQGEEVMPCSFCSSKGWKCQMMVGVSRCKECVRRGRSCDGTGVSISAITRSVKESQRLKAEESQAEEALSAALAKLHRIRRQRAFHQAQSAKMVNKGLEELDEADREESGAAAEATPPGAMGTVDWDAVGSFEDFSLFLGDQGFVGENHQSPQNTSSGVS